MALGAASADGLLNAGVDSAERTREPRGCNSSRATLYAHPSHPRPRHTEKKMTKEEKKAAAEAKKAEIAAKKAARKAAEASSGRRRGRRHMACGGGHRLCEL